MLRSKPPVCQPNDRRNTNTCECTDYESMSEPNISRNAMPPQALGDRVSLQYPPAFVIARLAKRYTKDRLAPDAL